MSDFEQWWNASKYMQVVFSNESTKRVALDGWQAAIASMQGEAILYAVPDWKEIAINGNGHTLCNIRVTDLHKVPLFTYPPDAASKIAEQDVRIKELEQQLEVARNQPRLTVKVRSFPESNGKRNWTALLVRSEPWGGLIGNCGGITVARGELWNRVAYEAERTRYLIGERDTEPHILDYGDDIRTPEEWAGEVRGDKQNVDAAIRQIGGVE